MKWFINLPKWFQIALIILALFIIYNIYIYIKNKISAKNFSLAVNQSQSAIDQLNKDGITPSYPQAQYTSMANSLEQTFIGCGLDWSNVIVPTFENMKNDMDVYQLIKAYNVRKIDECGWGSFNGDLSATLSYKLSGIILTIPNPSDIFTNASIASINKILKNNGLTFAF